MNTKGMDGLKMPELRKIAKKHGINSFGKTKAALIREIQMSEANFDCFGSAVEYCDQWGCRYRPLCFDEAKKWAPDRDNGSKPPRTRRRTK
jgi:hypothetical protein